MSRRKGTLARDLHRAWMEEPEYRKEYEALASEFTALKAVVKTGSARPTDTSRATPASRRSRRP
jgi:hypothetical protein